MASPLYKTINDWVSGFELGPTTTDFLTYSMIVGVAVVVGVVGHWIARAIISRQMKRLVEKTHTTFDDHLVELRVFDRLSLLVPGIVLYLTLPAAMFESGDARGGLERLLIVYMLVVGAMSLNAFLTAVDRTYHALPDSKSRPIKSYVQMAKLLMYAAIAIISIATLLGQSPWILLSGLGAMTAVLLLVFKDVLLGLVASIQLASHDMVRIGDWIQMPKYSVDGSVVDITLTTVKVRNWDNTLSLLPAYALVSDAFKNWRLMNELGGRRIKRSIPIDMTSVAFCTEASLVRFKRMTLLRPYIEQRLEEVRNYNNEHDVDLDEIVNGRRLTNLGTFRAYALAYLKAHPKVRQDMTLLVRQLAPEASGVPLEIYVFSAETAWPIYEGIQADIFDHLLAVIPEFGLRVLQHPTGHDVRDVATALHPPIPGNGTAAAAQLPRPEPN